MTDTDNKITLINDQAKIILTPGSTEAEAAQSSGDQIMTVHDVDERFGSDFQLEDLLTQSLRDKKPVDTNDVIFGERVMRIIISPILDDASQPLGCVVLLEDITEQKLLERSKDEFLSIASHELRTPLTAIRGNTAMIQQFYQSSVNDTNFSEMLEDIHDSSVRLIAIVNDFLDASRLEQGKMQFKPTEFDVSEVLENVAYEIAPIAKEKHNQVLVDKTLKSLPPVYADKDHVKQIVYNLIGNAMKFTENGKITLSVTTGDKRFLKVTVTDTGLGIPKDKQRLLFRKFQQAGPQIYTRETSRGTGLGLYISKLLVESMNGVIALESSEPGKGSTFSFTLPLAKS